MKLVIPIVLLVALISIPTYAGYIITAIVDEQSDSYVYTSFVLLDQMETRQGPLVNRTSPEDSLLLSYLLPQENNPGAHPAVKHTPAFKPVVRSKTDAPYAAVVDWITSLRYPHPEYGLQYRNPYRELVPTTQPAEEGAASQPRAATGPSSRPAAPPESAPATAPSPPAGQ